MMRRPERGLLLVCLIAAAFAGVQTWIGFWRYDIFRAAVDDGIFTQVIRSIGGCFCTTAEGGIDHLLVHWSPILILAYPFVKLGGTHGLILLQALAVAATAFPLYFIARSRASEMQSAAITAVAMLCPVLWAQTFTDFHENAFVPGLGATLAYAVVARSRAWGIFAAVALLMVKEDQFVNVALIGIIVALVYRRDEVLRWLGIDITAGAIFMGLMFFEVIRPSFHVPVPYLSLHFYAWHSPIPTPLGHVGLRSPERPEYLFWAFLPLLFLPLGSRLCWLALPGLLEVLASRERITMIFDTHYSMLWSGYVLAAFVIVVAYLLQRRRAVGIAAVAASAIACAAVLQYNDPMARAYYLYRRPDANDAQLQEIVDSLPQNAQIGSTDMIFAHAAVRAGAEPGVRGDYYLMDSALGDPTWDGRDKPALADALKSHKYRIVQQHDGIVVAKKAP